MSLRDLTIKKVGVDIDLKMGNSIKFADNYFINNINNVNKTIKE